MRVPAWVSERGRLITLVCAAALVLAGSAALASLLLRQPADEVEHPSAEPVLHAAQTAVPDTAATETTAPLTAVPTSAPTPAPTPPPASPAAATPAPEWSDWQEAHARYADDPAYITESRKEYRFVRVIYGESDWSAWSASPPPADSAITEAGYRTSGFTVIYDESPAVNGYTFTGVITSRPGAWSEWGAEAITPSETLEVETREEGGTSVVPTYRYSRYLYATQDGAFEASASNPGNGAHQTTEWMDAPLTPMGSGAYGTLTLNGIGTWFNEEIGQKEISVGAPVKRYRSRQIREMYEHAGWGDWSEWQSGTPPESTPSMKVEARYRFKTRTERIDAWSKWQEEAVEAKKDLKVETRTLYRYMPKP